MSTDQILEFIRDSIQEVKDELKEIRNHQSDQISKLHKRIDEVIETQHKFEIECKENDVRIERRIGYVGAAFGIVGYMAAELIKWIVPLLLKALK